MDRFPSYIGPAAFGVKMGVVIPGMDLVQEIVKQTKKCVEDGLIDNGDVLCITESVVARAQNNYVTLHQVAAEIAKKLKLGTDSKLGVVFPILSRNRFAMILQAIAKTVPHGEVVVQLAWPSDEVGNQIISDQVMQELGKGYYDIITEADIDGRELLHPVTGIDYLRLYREIIQAEGAKATLFFANDPKAIEDYKCDGVIVADIHTRNKTKATLQSLVGNLISLVDINSDPKEEAWSEWGLLGSNMSASNKLKLAPKNGTDFANQVQSSIKRATDKHIEVIIYGDGAYKDPSTGIYELADPRPVFGATSGFAGVIRTGIKYKYFADLAYEQGKSAHEIEAELKKLMRDGNENQQLLEGTTPRQMADIIASLADLVSGSADAGTPLVVVKGFLSPEK